MFYSTNRNGSQAAPNGHCGTTQHRLAEAGRWQKIHCLGAVAMWGTVSNLPLSPPTCIPEQPASTASQGQHLVLNVSAVVRLSGDRGRPTAFAGGVLLLLLLLFVWKHHHQRTTQQLPFLSSLLPAFAFFLSGAFSTSMEAC